jgi:hypothetical protein
VAIVGATLFILFPLAMLAMSTVTSLLVVRYFLPAAPGLVLLSAAGMAAAPLKRASNLLGVAAVLILTIGAVDYRDKPARMDFFPLMRFAESHDLQFGDAFSLNSGPVEPGLFYLGDRFTSITRASLGDLGSALAESASLWILAEDWTSDGNHELAQIREVTPGTIVCGFKTRSVVAYVAVRERSALPPQLNACEGVQIINR